jgi:hypothetical protein
MLGAMARIALSRHAAEGFSRIARLFVVFYKLPRRDQRRLVVVKEERCQITEIYV